MNFPDTYTETKPSRAQEIIGRLCDGVEELGAKCRQYLFYHEDEALLHVTGELGLEVKQLKTIPNFELGVLAIERPIFLQDMFALHHDLAAVLSSKGQSTSRHIYDDQGDDGIF